MLKLLNSPHGTLVSYWRLGKKYFQRTSRIALNSVYCFFICYFFKYILELYAIKNQILCISNPYNPDLQRGFYIPSIVRISSVTIVKILQCLHHLICRKEFITNIFVILHTKAQGIHADNSNFFSAWIINIIYAISH